MYYGEDEEEKATEWKKGVAKEFNVFLLLGYTFIYFELRMR